MNKENGFTLIELMVVIVIISLLSAIAIPQYQNFVIKSQLSRAYGEMSTLRVAVEICEADGVIGDTCDFDNINSSLYLANPQVEFQPSKISATFSGAVVHRLQGGEIILERNDNGVGWKCSMSFSGEVSDSLKPSGCRNE